MINRDDEREGFGSPDVVTDSSAILLANGLSINTNVVEWFNTDNVRRATAILTFTPSAITSVGDTIKLYASKNKVDGVDKSETFPSLTNKEKLLATFNIDVSLSEQTVTAEIQLNNCVSRQGYLFAIENLLTTVSVNAGWTLTIIPKTIGTN